MDSNLIKWSVNVVMGVAFVISFATGLLKFTLLLRVTGLNAIVFPSAFISDLHDWSGIILGLLVFTHLFLNRSWILSTTKKVITGKMSS
jgi:hypothetical protein